MGQSDRIKKRLEALKQSKKAQDNYKVAQKQKQEEYKAQIQKQKEQAEEEARKQQEAKEKQEEWIAQHNASLKDSTDRNVSESSNDEVKQPTLKKENKKYAFNFGLDGVTSYKDWKKYSGVSNIIRSASNTTMSSVVPQEFIDPSPVKPELQRGNHLRRYEEKKKKVDASIQELYGKEIDEFNREYDRLKKLDEDDGINGMDVDDHGNYLPNPRNRAEKYKEQFDNSEIGQKIKQTRNELMNGVDPNHRLAKEFVDNAYDVENPYANNFFGLLYGRDQAELLYSETKLNRPVLSDYTQVPIYTSAGTVYQTVSPTYDERETNKVANIVTQYDKQINEYKQKVDAVASYINIFGLPGNASILPPHIKKYMEDTGTYGRWYDSAGKPYFNKSDYYYTTEEASNKIDELANQFKPQATFGHAKLADPEQNLNDLSAQLDLNKGIYERATKYNQQEGDENQLKFNKESLKSFDYAQELIEAAKKHIRRNKEIKEAGDGWFGGGFWTTQNWYNMGVGAYDVLEENGITDLSVSKFLGLHQLDESRLTLALSDKMQLGKPLTKAEEMLASSIALEKYMHSEFGKYEDVAGYKAAKIGTESLKFMLETILTEGVTGIASKTIRGANMTLKAGLEANMARNAAIYAERYGTGTFGKFLGRQMAKAGDFTKLLGLQTGLSAFQAGVILHAKVRSDAYNAEAGEATYEINNEGQLIFGGFVDRKSPMEAWATSLGSMTIENLSEFSGEWGMGKFFKKPFQEFIASPVAKMSSRLVAKNGVIGKAVKSIGNFSSRVEQAIVDATSIDLRKGWTHYVTRPYTAFNDVLKMAHVGGLFGEIGEEYTAMPMQRAYDWVAKNMFDLNTSVTETKTYIDKDGNEQQYGLWDDVNPFTEHGRQTFFDIAYGIALSQAAFGFIGAGGYVNTRRKYNRAEAVAREAVGDKFDDYKSAIISADTKNLASVMSNIYTSVVDTKLRKALFDYYTALANYRGASAYMLKQAEENDKSLHQQALDIAESNGYTAQANGIYRDLGNLITAVHQSTLEELDLTEEQLQQEIQDHGNVEDFAKYLADNGQNKAAAQLLGEERLKARQSGALKVMNDTIQERIEANDEFLNRIVANDGSIYVALDSKGNTVYVTRGANEVNTKSGKSVRFDKNVVVVLKNGNIAIVNGQSLKDGERKNISEVKRLSDREIYSEYIEQFEKPLRSRMIGTPVLMGYNRIGTILGSGPDGRVMYSVNDGTTEDIRFGEQGETVQSLLAQWDSEYNNEIAEREILGAEKDLMDTTQHDRALVTASDEVVNYLNDLRTKQKEDIDKGGHGRAITYAEGKLMTKQQVKLVMKNLKRAKVFGNNSIRNFNRIIQNSANVLPDIVSWPRLQRVIDAWYAGNLTDKEMQYILSPESTNLSNSHIERLNMMIIDRYGNVRYGVKDKQTGQITYLNPLKFEDTTLSNEEIALFEHPEKTKQYTQFIDEPFVRQEEQQDDESDKEESSNEDDEKKPIKLSKTIATKIAEILKNLQEHSKKIFASTVRQADAINALLDHSVYMAGRVLHTNDCDMFIINKQGKIVMYHSNPVNFGTLFSERFRHEQTVLKRDALKVELNKIYTELGVDALIDRFYELEQESHSNFSPYIMYLQENPSEYRDVCESVATLHTARKGSGGSLIAESTMHDLLLQFFNGGETLDYENQTFQHNGKSVKVSDVMSKETYEKIIDNYNGLKEGYEKALGWKLIHNDNLVFTSIRFDSNLGRNINIATKPELVGVDKNGNYHVINIATAWDYFDNRAKTGTPIHRTAGQIWKKGTPEEVKVVKSLGKLYEDKLTLDADIIEENTGVECTSIEIQPWRVSYLNKDDNEHKTGYLTDAENTTQLNNGQLVPNRIVLTRNGDVLGRFRTEEQLERDAFKVWIREYIKDIQNKLVAPVLNELSQEDQDAFADEFDRLKEQIYDYIGMFNSGIFNRTDEITSIYEQLEELVDELNILIDIAVSLNQKAYDDRIAREYAESGEQHVPQTPQEYWEDMISEQDQLFTQIRITFNSKLLQIAAWLRTANEYKRNSGKQYAAADKASFDTVTQMFADLIETAEQYDNIVSADEVRRMLAMKQWFESNIIQIGQNEPELKTGKAPSLKPLIDHTAALFANATTSGKNKVTGKKYTNISTSVDQNGNRLTDVINNDDFIENSEFEFVLDVDEQNNNVRNPKLHVKITYRKNGTDEAMVFAPIAIRTNDTNGYYKPIVDAIKRGKKVVPSTKPVRIAGTPERNVGVQQTIDKTGLVKFGEVGDGVSVYDIGFDFEDQLVIGITQSVDDGNGGTEVVVKVPRKNNQVDEALQRNSGYNADGTRWQHRSEHRLSDGVVIAHLNGGNPGILNNCWVFLKKLVFKENVKQNVVDFVMRRPTLSEKDAQFIVDALLGAYSGTAKAFGNYCQINGITINASILDFVDMLIPCTKTLLRNIVDHTESVYLDVNDLRNGTVRLVGNIQDFNNSLNGTSYDINTAQGVSDLIRDLLKVEISVSLKGFANNRFDSSDYAMSHLYSIGQNLKPGQTITFGESRLQFDYEDFNHKDENGDNKPISGIGWYLKNGFLTTDYTGVVQTTNMSIDETKGFRVETEGQTNNEPEVDDKYELAISKIMRAKGWTREQAESFYAKAGGKKKSGLPKIQNKTKSGKKISKEKAIKELRRILGDSFGIKFVEDYIKDEDEEIMNALLQQNAGIVGRCYADLILLSELAESGTEYHEAFHRVLELLMDKHERNLVYTRFRKKNDIPNTTTDLQVAEMLADQFMDYMQNRLTLDEGILKAIARIPKWIMMMSRIGSYGLYKTYVNASKGKYRDVVVTDEMRDRFNKFSEGRGYFNSVTIHDMELEHTLNIPHYNATVDYLVYAAIHRTGQKLLWDGSNLGDFKITRQMFEHADFKQSLSSLPEAMQESINELLSEDNWSTVSKDLSDKISKLFNTVNVYSDDPHSSATDGQDQNNVDNFYDDYDPRDENSEMASAFDAESFKDSYEFSQFSRSTPRVKFFFSAVIKSTFSDDHKLIPINNSLGLPTIMTTSEVFNIAITRIHNCRNIPELITKLDELGKGNPVFYQLSQRLNGIWNEYKQSKIQNGRADADIEAFLSQLINSVRCTSMLPKMTEATVETHEGAPNVSITDIDRTYITKDYITEWASSFAFGRNILFHRSRSGEYVTSKNIDEKYETLMTMLDLLYDFSLNPNNDFVIIKNDDVLVYDANTEDGIYNIKRILCEQLNKCGIFFTTDMLDQHLLSSEKNSEMRAFKKFMSENSVSFKEFIEKIRAIYSEGQLHITDNDLINGKAADEYLLDAKFLEVLSHARYSYDRAHNQMTTQIADGAKQYSKGENNLLSSVVDDLNTRNDKFHRMFDCAYNKASLLMRRASGKPSNFEYVPYKGFTTNDPTDYGCDYTSMSEREDWTSKATILLQGHFVFPTMSDKKTWGWIDTHEAGIMPGLTPSMFSKNPSLIQKMVFGLTERFNDSWIYPITDQAADALIEYAKAEHNAIRELLETVCEKTPEGHLMSEMDMSKVKYKVKNFHEGGTFYVKDGKFLKAEDIKKIVESAKALAKAENENISEKELEKIGKNELKKYAKKVVQGARYSSLLGVYSNGEYKSFNTLCDADGKYTSPLDCYNLAEEHFFATRPEETEQEAQERRRKQVREQLSKQVSKQFDDLIRMGLVQMNGNFIENKGLDAETINSYSHSIRSVYPLATEQQAKDYAIRLYVADIVSRHVISMNEAERLFSGRISFFKWAYDSETGVVTDMRKDWSKRLGGLVSTGVDNNMYIDGIENDDAEYTCAIVENEMPDVNFKEELLRMTYETEIRSSLINSWRQIMNDENENGDLDFSKQDIDDVVNWVDLMEFADVENALRELLDDDKYNLAVSVAKDKAEAFGTTDVADGAAYMSDEMCERLLRMVGSYSKEVQKAFEILRDPNITSKLILNEAYSKVLTTVIGAQKYTAYGFRFEGGEAVPYYNKMALFPIFKCIATGNMIKIHQLMKDLGIDILHVESAVKVGISDSTPIDWEKVGTSEFKFSTRQQKYSELRKQFNTDPKDEELRSVGTQMTKIVMAALDLGRKYGSRTGAELRNDIMRCINKLSEYGSNTIMNDFFTTDESGKPVLDVEKFSKLLTKELQSRNAPYDLIDAVSIVEHKVEDEYGNTKIVKDFKIPLSALSSMAWILSILASYINKRVIDINMPGSAFYQRSVWGMEGNKPTVLTDDDLPDSINNGERLKVRNNGNSMDCVLSIDYFEHILEKAKIKTGRKVYKKDKDGNYVTKKKYVKADGSNVDPYEVFKYIYELHPEIHSSLVEARERSGEEGRTLESFWGTTTNTDPDLTGKSKNDFYNEALEAMGLSEDNIIEEKIEVDEVKKVSELSFNEQRQWLIDNNLIGPNAKANIIGYRIPTQALSSIHGMTCVDVLPVVRDTVILPAEFTIITGSDFDIDKLFLTTKHFQITDKGFGKVTDQFDEDTEEYYANRLVDNYMELLTDTRSFNQLNGSIDKDTEILKILDKKLSYNPDTGALDSYSTFSIRQLVLTKNEFVDGKTGIGPFALNNNSHVLTMLYGIKFSAEGNPFLAKLGLLNLDKPLDRDGRSISSWLSGLINAHVDVAKDSYISRLNVNPYTYNLTNLLIRTGLGVKTFEFMNQPILKQLSSIYSTASGTFLSEPGTTAYERQQKEEFKFILDYAKSGGYGGKDRHVNQFLKNYAKHFKNTYGISIDDACGILFSKEDNNFETHATQARVQDLKTKQNTYVDLKAPNDEIVSLSFVDFLLVTYYAKKQFDTPAKHLADVVKYSKIDTKKQGKTITEQHQYVKGYRKVFFENGGMVPIFNENITKMAEDSYIDYKTNIATNLLRQILAPNFIEATNTFLEEVDMVLSQIDARSKENIKVISLVTKSIMASIKSKWFFDAGGFCKINNIDPVSLFKGNDSIFNRFIGLTGRLMKDEDLKYVDANGQLNNYLLKSLVATLRIPKDGEWTGSKFADYRFVRLANELDGESLDGESLTQAWDELLHDSDEEIREFARDLVVYAYAVSADTGGLFDLCKYVPNSFKTEFKAGDSYQTYDKYMRSVTNYYNGNVQEGDVPVSGLTQTDIDEIIINNMDHSSGAFVPNLKDTAERKMTVLKRGRDTKTPILIAGFTKTKEQVKSGTGIFYDRLEQTNEDDCPRFFKLPANNVTGWFLYKRVALVKLGNVQFPIYAPCLQLGRKFKKGYRVQEYSRGNNMNTVPRHYYLQEAMNYTEDLIRSITSQVYDFGKHYVNSAMDAVIAALKDKEDRDVLEQNGDVFDDSYSEQAPVYDISRELIANNNLLLDTKDPKYSLISEAEMVDKELVQRGRSLKQSGYHIEYYTKKGTKRIQTGTSKKGRPLYKTETVYNQVMCISFPNQANKGFFEIVCDKESGYYSIHIKTMSKKVNKPSKFASVPLEDNEKESLFAALIYAIPMNGKVSTWGTLSKGGLHAIETLGERSNGMLKKTDETRHVKLKGDGRVLHVDDETGDREIRMPGDIEIPVWLKISDTATSTNQSTTSVEQQTDNGLVITGDSKNTAETAKRIGGIDTLRHPDSNGMHFGNPFSHTNYNGVLKVMPNVKEAVIAFELWLRGTAYQDVEPQRRQWILDQINSGALDNKPIVYYTDKVPDDSYGRSTYDYNEAPNHAHILQKLINEYRQNLLLDQQTINTTISTLNSESAGLTQAESKSVVDLIGDNKPRVLIASETTDPVWHAKKIKEMVEEELKKQPKDRKFHMMYLITKHDGLPLRELAELKIPKFIHFSITSLGGSKYEPGVMKMDDMLDRIQSLINDKVLNPNLVTIRIDPIVPGVTTKEGIEHIVQRATEMGIRQFKFSVMDSYGYTQSGEKSTNPKDRYIIQKMELLGYDWGTYYGKVNGVVNFNAKNEYVAAIYQYMDQLAQKYNVWFNTCGEQPTFIAGLKRIRTNVGCVNVDAMNAAMGTTDIANVQGQQRKECSCYGNKIDALKFNDKCASSCVYCYAKHNSDAAVKYYNEDGTLKDNRFTRTSNLYSENGVIQLNQQSQQQAINIYAGTNENADLSNFAERPFTIPFDFSLQVPSRMDISHGTVGIDSKGNDIVYRSVESAFQGIKSVYSDTGYPNGTDFEALRKQGKALREEDFAKMSGPEARRNGRNITDLDRKSWDMDSSVIMKALIKLSFEQNPQALKRLLATGNATLTHTQDKGKWGTEFPKLLMEVRDEFLKQQNDQLVQQSQSSKQYYEGKITPEPNVIFVFGSNPEGRHGLGAAKVARELFGAQYGVGEGLTGNAYALPTKDLRVKENNGYRSIPKERIVESIKKMYDVARQHPDKIFKVAYDNTTVASLNGYTGIEMIHMFQEAGKTPSNVQFSKAWYDYAVAERSRQSQLSETELIKQQAIANGTFMKAPNGKPTNLSEELWLYVRTKEFKDWFGDWENDPTNASKVVDENGEPLVVWHGGALNITEFKASGINTGSGTYTDPNTGEKIPLDSNRAIFFSSSKSVGISYGHTHALYVIYHLRKKVGSLLRTSENGVANVDHETFASLEEVFDLFDKLAKYNPRFTALKEHIQKLLSSGKRLNAKEVGAYRELLKDAFDNYVPYLNQWDLNISEWIGIYEESVKLLNKLNNQDAIHRLKNGYIPKEITKTYKIQQLDNDNLEKIGKEPIADNDEVIVWTGRHNYIKYDGKLLSYHTEYKEVNFVDLSEHEIGEIISSGLITSKNELREYVKDKDNIAMNAQSQLYSAFLNVKNPLVHDYEGTHLGHGYKNSEKYPFGYIAARLVNSAINNGNDGVVYQNLYDPFLADNYGVFDPSLIRVINDDNYSDFDNDFDDDAMKECKG